MKKSQHGWVRWALGVLHVTILPAAGLRIVPIPTKELYCVIIGGSNNRLTNKAIYSTFLRKKSKGIILKNNCKPVLICSI